MVLRNMLDGPQVDPYDPYSGTIVPHRESIFNVEHLRDSVHRPRRPAAHRSCGQRRADRGRRAGRGHRSAQEHGVPARRGARAARARPARRTPRAAAARAGDDAPGPPRRRRPRPGRAERRCAAPPGRRERRDDQPGRADPARRRAPEPGRQPPLHRVDELDRASRPARDDGGRQGLPRLRRRAGRRAARRARSRARGGAGARLRDRRRRARAGPRGHGRARARGRRRHRGRALDLGARDAADTGANCRPGAPPPARGGYGVGTTGVRDDHARSSMTHDEILQGLYDNTLIGNAPEVKDLTNAGLADGLDPEKMLYDALIPSLEEVGARFERGDFFVPEMLIAARAMQGALDILRPLLAETGAQTIGTYVMGTVKGDVHDIGKNLVNIMLEGAGFTVYDLGVNVAPEVFVEKINEHQPDIVGFSAFLTTTMPMFKANINALEKAGIRNDVIVMVGGAPVTQEYADMVGADGYAADASTAVRLAKDLIEQRRSAVTA